MNFIKKFKYEILIFLIFVFSRSFDLGHDMFNTDVWKWKTRSYDFSTGVFNLDFAQTIQKYHPGVTLMWLGTVGIKLFNLYNDVSLHVSFDSIQAIFGLHTFQKFMVVIALGISLFFAFYGLKKLFKTKYALFAIGLLIVEPFYVGLTRTFHLEGLQSTFMLVSIIWFYYWFESDKKEVKRLFVTCFFAALAILTKTSALYLVLFYGLWLLLDTIRNKKKFKELVFNYFQWLLPTLFFIFLLWPALWVVPGDVINTLYRGVAVVGVEQEHIQYFFGQLVSDPGWYFYIVVFLLRSSWFLLLGFIWILLKKKNKFINYNLLYILFYLIMLSIPSKKLDRYILPVLVSGVLLAAFFFEYYLDKVKSKFKYFIFLFPILFLLWIHPNYLSYYSSGLKLGMYAIEPKWMIGQKEIVAYFKDIQEKENYVATYDKSFEELINNKEVSSVLSVGFQEKYYTQIWPFFREFGAWAVIKDLTPFATRTKYFVYPVWNDESQDETRFSIEYLDTIKIRGVDTYNVYRRANP